MRVVFTGASGQGKSTMANYVAGAYDLPVAGKSGAEVAAELGCPHAEIDARGLRDRYQLAVADAVLDAFFQGPAAFVTDRGFDFAAYAALEGFAAARYSSSVNAVACKMQDCAVFLVEPSVDLTTVTRQRRGDTKYLDWDYIQRVHGGILTLLHLYRVPFHPVTMTDPGERGDFLRSVLDPLRAKETAGSLDTAPAAR